MLNANNSPSGIRPAGRIAAVDEYYFSKKLREIAALNLLGRDIISLGIGGPDCPPHPSVVETLRSEALMPDAHSYQPTKGLPELRRAFAGWYRRIYGVELDPDSEIQPLIGSKEGILHITMAFLNPGDGVLIPDPGYPAYSAVSRLAGAETFTYDLTEERGWMPDFEALERLPLGRIRLMWVNYPNMPTGTPATAGLFSRLVDFGRRHSIVIVNDNPYSLILNPQPLSILATPGARDIAIEMNSLSKSHNMAGWRMAAVAANPQFISWILRVKSNVDSGQFRPMMLSAARALDLPQSWYDGQNNIYARRRVIAEEVMRSLGCRFDPTQRGLFLWGRIPDGSPSSAVFADDVLSRARVFITPGFIFGSNGERYIRISLCAPEPRLREALGRINRAGFGS